MLLLLDCKWWIWDQDGDTSKVTPATPKKKFILDTRGGWYHYLVSSYLQETSHQNQPPPHYQPLLLGPLRGVPDGPLIGLCLVSAMAARGGNECWTSRLRLSRNLWIKFFWIYERCTLPDFWTPGRPDSCWKRSFSASILVLGSVYCILLYDVFWVFHWHHHSFFLVFLDHIHAHLDFAILFCALISGLSI